MAHSTPIIRALQESLEANPRQPELWVHLADLFLEGSDTASALDALRNAEQAGDQSPETLARLVGLLRQTGSSAEALIRVERALGDHPGAPALILEQVRVLHARGDSDDAREAYEAAAGDLRAMGIESFEGAVEGTSSMSPTPPSGAAPPAEPKETATPELLPPAAMGGDETDLEEWASQFDWGDLKIDFSDVVGLEEVKRQIRLRIIAPQGKRHVMQAFGRKSGGGILLYGPPGCGKTYIARATAGEVKARFISVGIHDVLDKFYGESEKMIHALFEEARTKAPTVLFFDEFDAFAAGRKATSSPFYQTVVDQLLQEMDGVHGSNENVLVFAATNVPWHVDTAFRRPGRFDRLFFLPPPDTKGRLEYLRRAAEKLPGGDSMPLKALAKGTALYTFADLKSLVERSSERALEASLLDDEIHPLSERDFTNALESGHATSLEWLASARNYARFSNEGGQYDDLAKYLKKTKKL